MTHTTPALRISLTAQQYGYGTDRYKTITRLSTEERAAVLAGERIFLRAARASAKGPKGTFWRVATKCGAAIGPRVPAPDELALLRTITGLL